MRALFLVIVLANVAFFIWARYVAPPEAAADPLPLGRQIEPEKLKVVSPAEVAALNVRPPVAAAPVALKCLEWGSFALADVPRAQSALEPLGLGGRLTQRRTEDSAGWWVFIAPQGSRPAALKKAAELKTLAIDDYFILQEEGPLRWALSLGVFRTEEAAQARLAALRDQGVRSAQIGPRETAVPKIWLQVKGIDAALQARLDEIARGVEGTELRDCPQ
jgi:SPOR domain